MDEKYRNYDKLREIIRFELGSIFSTYGTVTREWKKDGRIYIVNLKLEPISIAGKIINLSVVSKEKEKGEGKLCTFFDIVF